MGRRGPCTPIGTSVTKKVIQRLLGVAKSCRRNVQRARGFANVETLASLVLLVRRNRRLGASLTMILASARGIRL